MCPSHARASPRLQARGEAQAARRCAESRAPAPFAVLTLSSRRLHVRIPRAQWEALPHALPAYRAQQRVRAFLRATPPDAVALIDYPGVNLPFARWLRECVSTGRARIVYYIPPNEWLLSTARTPALVRDSDRVLCVYPDEAEYYEGAGADVRFVGHPLVDEVKVRPRGARSADLAPR